MFTWFDGDQGPISVYRVTIDHWSLSELVNCVTGVVHEIDQHKIAEHTHDFKTQHVPTDSTHGKQLTPHIHCIHVHMK